MTGDLRKTRTPAPGDVHREEHAISRAHHFAHEAMATVFEVYILDEDREYARQGAQAAFEEVDRLEQELSRYIENSDISRLNRAPARTPIPMGIDSFECLRAAKEMFDQTGGVFDVTVGSLYACWLNPDKTLRSPSAEELDRARSLTSLHHLRLDKEAVSAEVEVAGVQFDLGGIGKGYAAEKMGEILKEWSLNAAMILAGASSVLALEPPGDAKGWPVTLRNPSNRNEILIRAELSGAAVSGSGLERGRHIIDPRPGRAGPVEGKLAAWSLASDATVADALSTAFMIMEPAEIDALCGRRPGYAGLTVEAPSDSGERGAVRRFGLWRSERSIRADQSGEGSG